MGLFWTTDTERNDTWTAYTNQRGYALLERAPALRIRAEVLGVQVYASEGIERVTTLDENNAMQEADVRRAYVNAAPLMPIGDLAVRGEGFAAKLSKLFGGQDIKVGEPEFDSAFLIRCSQPELAPRVLTPNARRALLQARRAVPNLIIAEGRVSWEGNELKDAAQLDALIQAVASVAAALGR